KSALVATAGVLTANAGYFLVAVLGLAAIIAVSVDAFNIIRWIGAGYLIWIGLKMIVQAFSNPDRPLNEPSPLKALGQGFVTQAANPNLIFYFSAILPQFVEPDSSASVQVLILGVSSLAIEALVLYLYTRIGSAVKQASTAHVRSLLSKLGGGMLVGSGILLGLMNRTQEG
ncbi:MAG: LysE family translocator, partial [Gammaproteobacteria bacterium]|nr:LysE family translocator [Gammaproteobacteria bacterium]